MIPWLSIELLEQWLQILKSLWKMEVHWIHFPLIFLIKIIQQRRMYIDDSNVLFSPSSSVVTFSLDSSSKVDIDDSNVSTGIIMKLTIVYFILTLCLSHSSVTKLCNKCVPISTISTIQWSHCKSSYVDFSSLWIDTNSTTKKFCNFMFTS
jgi:hypothetical protein